MWMVPFRWDPATYQPAQPSPWSCRLPSAGPEVASEDHGMQALLASLWLVGADSLAGGTTFSRPA
jgi:hypothetical protein